MVIPRNSLKSTFRWQWSAQIRILWRGSEYAAGSSLEYPGFLSLSPFPSVSAFSSRFNDDDYYVWSPITCLTPGGARIWKSSHLPTRPTPTWRGKGTWYFHPMNCFFESNKKKKRKIAGIFFVLPCIEAYQKVDLRTITLGVPPQEVNAHPLHALHITSKSKTRNI